MATISNNNPPPPRQFLRYEILLTKKKLTIRKMFTDLIIEFEWRKLRPPNRKCTPKTGYFHGKTKISKANIRVIVYCKKYGRTQFTLLL